MALDDDGSDDEAVERRRALRGTVVGLRVSLTAPREATFDAVEASPRAFFVRAADPEAFRLGEVFEAVVEHRARRAAVRLEVIRKELHPRSGVALRVATIDAGNRAVLEEILGPIAEREELP